MLPFAGTADRDSGTNETIGVEGPRIPPGASPETRNLYGEKLRVVPWKPEFARYGNRGGHTDTVSAAFIAHYVAPLVKTTSDIQFAAAPTAASGMVTNPDYNRWAEFTPGSWILFEGTKTIDGVKEPIRVKTTLISKTGDSVIFQRDEMTEQNQLRQTSLTQTLYESAMIDPADNPLTCPSGKVESLPEQFVRVNNQNIACKVQTISAPAEFSAWGSHPSAILWTNPNIPGGIARIEITTKFQNKTVHIQGQVMQYRKADDE